jgi:hypothetical protein
MFNNEDGAPCIISPLTLEGRPFISSSLKQKYESPWTSIHGKWKNYQEDLNASWSKTNINEWFEDKWFEAKDSFWGFFGSSPANSEVK